MLEVSLGNNSRGGGDWAATFATTLPGFVSPTAMLNQWSHLAFTYNSTAAQWSAYLNGQLVTAQLTSAPVFGLSNASFGLSGAASNFTYANTYLFTPSSPLYLATLNGSSMTIGAQRIGANSYAAYFAGNMDQLQIFGTLIFFAGCLAEKFVFSGITSFVFVQFAFHFSFRFLFLSDSPLSAKEVLDFARLPLNRTGVHPYYPPSLRAYYTFDEGQRQSLTNFQGQLLHVQDRTVNENHGSLVGMISSHQH